MGWFSSEPTKDEQEKETPKPPKDVLPNEAPESFKSLDFYNNLHIETESECYWGGDKIKGNVYYFNTENVEVYKFFIELKCDCSVSNGEGAVTFNYFKRSFTFLKDTTILPPGYHVFPFSIELEPEVKGTIKNPFGRIIWMLEANVDRKDSIIGKLMRVELSSIGSKYQSLNKVIRVVSSPDSIYFVEKRATYNPQKNGDQISASIEIPSTKITNKLEVTVTVDNRSTSELKGFKLKIINKQTGRVKMSQSRYITPIIIQQFQFESATYYHESPIPASTKFCQVISLDVPEYLSTFHSAWLDVEHDLVLKVYGSGFFLLRSDIELKLPVTIIPAPKSLLKEEPIPSIQLNEVKVEGKQESEIDLS